MTLPTITIRKKKYPAPSVDRLKRKAVKELQPKLKLMQDGEFEVLWDILGLLMPAMEVEVLDDLDLGEVKQVLEDAGIAKFTEDADDAEISVGESSASTSS